VLSAAWRRDAAAARQSVTQVFESISRPGDSSLAITALAQFLPASAVAAHLDDVAGSAAQADRAVLIVACHMVDWLRWPMPPHVSQWIVRFVRQLAVAEKYSVLMEIAELKVMQVCSARR